MKKEKYSFEYSRFENKLALGTEQKIVVDQAFEIAQNAYAPYSKFKVGASVQLENGEIFSSTALMLTASMVSSRPRREKSSKSWTIFLLRSVAS